MEVGRSPTAAEGLLPTGHHEHKRGRLLVPSHELPHILRKGRIVLPLLEAVLEEFRGVVTVAVQHVLMEALLAEHLAVVDLDRVLGHGVAEIWNS